MVQSQASLKAGASSASMALVDFIYQLADDELIVGHRSSEWLGMAPDIEEDVAFASMAQDEIGHATFFYGLLETLGEGSADELAFARPVATRRNARFLESENGDWAETITRRLFYEVFEQNRLSALLESCYEPLAQGAQKIMREEYYHLLHIQTYFQRLASAGGEARRRLENAVQRLLPLAGDLFDLGPHRDALLETGILNRSEEQLRNMWLERIGSLLQESGLSWPEATFGAPATRSGRRGEHTPALHQLLKIMGEVYFSDPGARW
ncbi:1,2-phenylacetyl-CoA epoxidase subunit PaaC [Alicyclobacillus dauci]|uniref:Phenylacetate-CoA oxygenase subunit PaaC n=1 Tax=Alicyclobacillus dauci TaxID=1475485 RepID=A0ABY6YY15_9BACL|nr:1,2-phenylacetyl-CoA epoxidase subunit PaaC [Alicyclobacillus dauci]WAH35173.1 phenylacetate-CoA oxygenase subunit PaaC [Alicyclobacillus dauci]